MPEEIPEHPNGASRSRTCIRCCHRCTWPTPPERTLSTPATRSRAAGFTPRYSWTWWIRRLRNEVRSFRRARPVRGARRHGARLPARCRIDPRRPVCSSRKEPLHRQLSQPDSGELLLEVGSRLAGRRGARTLPAPPFGEAHKPRDSCLEVQRAGPSWPQASCPHRWCRRSSTSDSLTPALEIVRIAQTVTAGSTSRRRTWLFVGKLLPHKAAHDLVQSSGRISPGLRPACSAGARRRSPGSLVRGGGARLRRRHSGSVTPSC